MTATKQDDPPNINHPIKTPCSILHIHISLHCGINFVSNKAGSCPPVSIAPH
jgi:hypothetical protein